MDICNECGHSVKPGSGNFVNRVPDCNDVETRKENGKRFPEGDFICAECENKRYSCTRCGAELEFTGTGYGKMDSDLCTECYNREEDSDGHELLQKDVLSVDDVAINLEDIKTALNNALTNDEIEEFRNLI